MSTVTDAVLRRAVARTIAELTKAPQAISAELVADRATQAIAEAGAVLPIDAKPRMQRIAAAKLRRRFDPLVRAAYRRY